MLYMNVNRITVTITPANETDEDRAQIQAMKVGRHGTLRRSYAERTRQPVTPLAPVTPVIDFPGQPWLLPIAR